MSTYFHKFSGSSLIPVLLGCMATALLAGCVSKQGKEGGAEVTELRYQGYDSRVSIPELAEDLGYLAPLKLKWVGNTISGPQDIQAATSGDVDFGGAFTGSIVKLIAAKAPIRMLVATSGLNENNCTGYYVLNDSPVRKGRDLIGRKIAVNTVGAHHEFMIREYLRREGLSNKEIKEVSLVVLPPLNGEQTLRQRQVDVTALGSIMKDKALERGGIRPLFTDYGLFGELSTWGFVMTDRFIAKNPKATRKFVESTAKAIEWARTHPRDEVIARFRKIIANRGRHENGEPLKYWKSTGVAGKGGVIADKEVQLWIDWLVKDGQLKDGEVKAAAVYTNEFNPYLADTGK